MPDLMHGVTLFVGRIAAAIFGALAGVILTTIVVWFVCRMTINRQPPRSLRKLLRILGALGGALAAVLFLPIGYGGFGLGSGGFGLGPGGGGFTPPEAHAPESPPPDDKPSSDAPRGEQRARVAMLGGSLVRGDAFYRWEDDTTRRALLDIQSRLRSRMDADPPLTVLEIVIYFEDSLARQSAPVARLSDWASQAGLSVRVVTVPGHIPP